MDLLVITPEKNVPAEAAIVNDLFARGLQRLHVRKQVCSAAQYRDYITSIDPRYYSRIVVHASFELFREFGLGGIHLNSHLRTDDKVWKLIADIPQSAISTSFHSWQEIEANDFSYNYVFISPVFDSISKAGYTASIDLNKAAVIKEKLKMQSKYCPKIIGLGGVGADQLEELSSNGFDGAAMLGAIWLSEEPMKAFVAAMAVINTIKAS